MILCVLFWGLSNYLQVVYSTYDALRCARFTPKGRETKAGIVSFVPSDPSHVIGLFPDLLPQQYWNQLEYPDSLPDLQGRDMENGLVALADYLIQVTL